MHEYLGELADVASTPLTTGRVYHLPLLWLLKGEVVAPHSLHPILLARDGGYDGGRGSLSRCGSRLRACRLMLCRHAGEAVQATRELPLTNNHNNNNNNNNGTRSRAADERLCALWTLRIPS